MLFAACACFVVEYKASDMLLLVKTSFCNSLIIWAPSFLERLLKELSNLEFR